MADSELGELRRPPRTLEQRLERAARWRKEGMAAGTADTLYPGTINDDLVFASSGVAGDSGSGGGGGGSQWFADTFAVTTTFAAAYTLTYTPVEFSEVVRVNGVVLTPRTEYTLEGRSMILVDPTDLGLGIAADTWDLTVSYAYADAITGDAGEFGYVADVDSHVVPADVLADDVALLAVDGRASAVSGVYATWTKIYDGTGTNSNLGVDLWLGTGIGVGDTINWTIGGVTEHGKALAVFRGITGTVSIRDDDTTTVSYLPSDPDTLAAPAVTAVIGDLIICMLRCTGGTYPDDATTYTWTGFDGAAVRSHITGIYANGVAIAAGIATATSVQTTFKHKFVATGARTLQAVNVALQVTP